MQAAGRQRDNDHRAMKYSKRTFVDCWLRRMHYSQRDHTINPSQQEAFIEERKTSDVIEILPPRSIDRTSVALAAPRLFSFR
jgi:hypothetical protein